MYCVIRNGQYIESEKILFGDMEVPKRPHENAEFINGSWLLNADLLFAELDKSEAEEFLQSTDWKVIRHKEQQDLGVETTLTQDEYLELITKRQEWRNILNDITN